MKHTPISQILANAGKDNISESSGELSFQDAEMKASWK